MADALPLTGILPLARPTFDVPFAQEKLAAMVAALEAAGIPLAGPRHLLMDADATRQGMEAVRAAGAARVLILQVTFTDAAMTAEIAAAFDQPLAIWAIPEPRLGGRLRLNSLCGLNLAAHALGLRGRAFSWLFADPGASGLAEDLGTLVSGEGAPARAALEEAEAAHGPGADAARALRGATIGRLGTHPAGFDTCDYDPAGLMALAGVGVEELDLSALFERARAVPPESAAAVRAEAEAALTGLETVDADELDRSLRLKVALEDLAGEKDYAAFAIRCWPETFTEYGGAVCGPVSMMGEERTPCACESDVYGALTSRLLQEIAGAPAFLVDLVDVDTADDTAVVWHCGQAPRSMCAPGHAAEATIHSNRRMPLLFQFPLKAGPVTFARISQAERRPRMVIAAAEMLDRPLAFSGTSGVLRFGAPAGRVLREVIDSRLEHHMALAYGDHREALREAAGALGLPVHDMTR